MLHRLKTQVTTMLYRPIKLEVMQVVQTKKAALHQQKTCYTLLHQTIP